MGWLDTFRKPKPNVIEEYSVNLFKNTVKGVEAIKRLSEDKSIESERYGLNQLEWFSVFNEFQYFFLHLTDRIAFDNMMDDKRRNEVLSELERWNIDLSVQTICSDWPADQVEKIKKESMQNFIKSMNQYSQCKEWFAKKGESPKGTLFGEFGKQVAYLAGREMDIVYVTCSMESAMDTLKELNMKAFIEKVK